MSDIIWVLVPLAPFLMVSFIVWTRHHQKIAEVQTWIDARRPVTANPTVVAPIAAPLNMSIQLLPSSQAIRDAVTAEIADLLRREAVPGGTILLTHLREAISIAAGETDHVLISPVANVTHATGLIAVPGVITWS